MLVTPVVPLRWIIISDDGDHSTVFLVLLLFSTDIYLLVLELWSGEVYSKHCGYSSLETPVVSNPSTYLCGYWDDSMR